MDWKKGMAAAALGAALCALTGCGTVMKAAWRAHRAAAQDTVEFSISEESPSYLTDERGAVYAVLAERADGRGQWYGTVDEYAVVRDGVFAGTAAMGSDEAETLEPGSMLVPYYNVYRQTDGGLCVEIEGGLYRLSSQAQAEGCTLYHPGAREDETEVTLDDARADRLHWGARTYRVTEQSARQGEFLGALNVVTMCDARTGETIPREDWARIERVPGRLSGQQRQMLRYGAVYTAKGYGRGQALAVEVDGKLQLALPESGEK